MSKESRENLDNRVKAWTENKRPKPERKSAEDILAAQEARAAKLAQKREERGNKFKWLTPSNIVGLLALAGAGAFAFFGNQVADRYENQFAVNEAAIATLEEETAPLFAASEELDETEREEALSVASSALDEAGIAAVKVADLQNLYQGMEIKTVPREGGGADVVGAEEIAANSEKIGEFFPGLEQSGVARSWFTMNIQDGENWVKAPVGAFEWKAGETWTMTGANSARVVWEARDSANGDLLAWAVGNWNNEISGFDKVTVGVTSQGKAYEGATNSGNPGGQSGDEA